MRILRPTKAQEKSHAVSFSISLSTPGLKHKFQSTSFTQLIPKSRLYIQ